MGTDRELSWRASDAVAYEQMRQLSDLLVARMIMTDRPRALAIRRDTFAIDGFDRPAIDRRSREVADMLREVLA